MDDPSPRNTSAAQMGHGEFKKRKHKAGKGWGRSGRNWGWEGRVNKNALYARTKFSKKLKILY